MLFRFTWAVLSLFLSSPLNASSIPLNESSEKTNIIEDTRNIPRFYSITSKSGFLPTIPESGSSRHLKNPALYMPLGYTPGQPAAELVDMESNGIIKSQTSSINYFLAQSNPVVMASLTFLLGFMLYLVMFLRTI